MARASPMISKSAMARLFRHPSASMGFRSESTPCPFLLIGKRAFADSAAAPSANKLRLTLAAPYNVYMKEQVVGQVNVSSTDGDLGILAGHVPLILQLKPGLLEVFVDGPASTTPNTKKSFFISGGFATVNPDSTMQVAGMEICTVDQLDAKVVADGLAKVQARQAASAAATPEEKAEIAILTEVYTAMNNALGKTKTE